jgi:hypothetical protein
MNCYNFTTFDHENDKKRQHSKTYMKYLNYITLEFLICMTIWNLFGWKKIAWKKLQINIVTH